MSLDNGSPSAAAAVHNSELGQKSADQRIQCGIYRAGVVTDMKMEQECTTIFDFRLWDLTFPFGACSVGLSENGVPLNSLVYHVFASGWKTARVVVLLFEYGGWVGWGGILTFMYHAYRRGCYVTGQGLGGVGWDINVHVPCVHTWMLRCCYVTGQGLGGVGWDINVHVPCVQTWMLRCCYVTGQGLGGVGWDINVG